jgi:hypothetical protein
MILPSEYVDETCGVRPAPNHPSFNNVIFSAWYHFARDKQGKFNKHDLDAMLKHLNDNDDGNGLYKPKNSHDNLTYKMLMSKHFELGMEDKMSFSKAAWSIGLYRVWDVITYGAVFGPKPLRPLFGLLMIIPAVQSLISLLIGSKIRPQLFEPKSSQQPSRFPWWFRKKKLIDEMEIHDGLVTIKTWLDYKGQKRVTRHMQNDGTHLAVFRLAILKKDFLVCRIAAKIAKKILIKRYGNDYVYGIINKYFRDRKHPVIDMWKGYGDIL